MSSAAVNLSATLLAQQLFHHQHHDHIQKQHQEKEQQQQQLQLQQHQREHRSQSRLAHLGDLLPTTSLLYCALLAFLLISYKRQRRETQSRKLAAKLKRLSLKSLPSPPPMPLIGHLHLMRDHPKDPWEGFNAIRAQWGDIVSLQMGIHKMVLLSSVDYMNEALIRKGDIFADRPEFPRHHIVFGGDKENSLALCNWSNTHRARRKFCKRGVVPNKLSARYELLESIIRRTVGKFVADTKNRFDTSNQSERIAKSHVLFLTGDVFLEFLCEERYAHADPAYARFNQHCDFIFYDVNQCYLLDFLPYLTRLGLGYFYLKQLKNVTDSCRNFIDDKIFEPRHQAHLRRTVPGGGLGEAADQRPRDEENDDYQQTLFTLDFTQGANTPEDNLATTTSTSKQDDYLDSIIKEHISGASSMSLDDYKVGFADLLAGHAAVTNILMRLLGHLSLDPEMQELICEEARRTKATSMEELPVTMAALMEAMRLASSPIVPHVAREDTSLGDYFVPKGSALLFNCYNINLSPELWQEPRRFNPRRFVLSTRNAQGEVSNRLSLPKYFMPFSVGQRQCLGYKMVETISVMAAANICANFTLRPNNEQLVRRLLEPKGTVALSPLEECFEFEFEPRHR